MASTYTEQDQAALAACHESAARLVAEMLTVSLQKRREALSYHLNFLFSTQKQEHLDNLDQIRMKIARKKVACVCMRPTHFSSLPSCLVQATVESQLRSAVQTQLDGVDNGLDRMRLLVITHTHTPAMHTPQP